MHKNILLFVIVSIVLVGCSQQPKKTEVKESLPTEQFIQKHLLKDDKLQTNMTTLTDEYLAESLGLWMQYLVAQQNYEAFDTQVQRLNEQFLLPKSLVSWQVNGKDASTTSALIDDLRIVDALYAAFDLWGIRSYESLAEKIESAVVKYEQFENVFVDYYDSTAKQSATVITLSYIAPHQLERIGGEQTVEILLRSPKTAKGFYPLNYDVKKEKYTFPAEINMIDQFYIAYHLAQANEDVSIFVTYCKQMLESEGKLYGRVKAQTMKPTVSYESPAVYALAILMAIEVQDEQLALQLYERMTTLRVKDTTNAYYGGYLDEETLMTHTFDNLLPLLAERRLFDEKIL